MLRCDRQTMPPATFTIGLIGIGNAAELHAMAIDDIPHAEVVAGSCRTEDKGVAFAERFDCDWYPTTDDLLAEAAPDIVTVCTPSGAHLEPVLKAAEAGIDVLCEKPLEITTERIDRMIEAAETAEIRLGGVFQQRFNPVVETVHDAATRGRFGDLAVANAYVPWWRDDEYYRGSWKGTQALDGGGALMNQSIHGIDAVQWLAAAALETSENPVAEVMAYTSQASHDEELIEVEDTAVASIRYRGKALGQILGATSMYPGSLKRLEIAGRDGTAAVLEDELIAWQFRDSWSDDAEIRDRFSQTATSGGAGDPMDVDVSNHTRNIEAFLAAVANDGPYRIDAREARKAVAIIESIYASAEQGTPVTVNG